MVISIFLLARQQERGVFVRTNIPQKYSNYKYKIESVKLKTTWIQFLKICFPCIFRSKHVRVIHQNGCIFKIPSRRFQTDSLNSHSSFIGDSNYKFWQNFSALIRQVRAENPKKYLNMKRSLTQSTPIEPVDCRPSLFLQEIAKRVHSFLNPFQFKYISKFLICKHI